MNKEQFNLSEKRCEDTDAMYPNVVYSEKDVKEFIRRLKEEKKHIIGFECANQDYKDGFWDGINFIIKKVDILTGDKLK